MVFTLSYTRLKHGSCGNKVKSSGRGKIRIKCIGKHMFSFRPITQSVYIANIFLILTHSGIVGNNIYDVYYILLTFPAIGGHD